MQARLIARIGIHRLDDLFRAYIAPLLIGLAFCLAASSAAWAQVGSARYSSVVIDAGSGNIVSAINPDEPRYPASLTKMMTLYLTFEALRDRRVALAQEVPVSWHASAMMPSKLGLLPGSRITVEQSILALVTKSANDAAAALGELLGGDEERFAQMMTLRARAMGMSRTVFRNASGLPDLDQITTARDLATLARHLVQDFPSEYRYFSVPSFLFRGRLIPNHDHMLESYPGADGIKTGYIEASGFNLVTSALRGDVRLIGVVLGAARSAERDQHMAALLDAGFEQLGVPIEPARPLGTGATSLASRLGLVGTAQAATLPELGPAPALAFASHVPVTRVASRHAVVQTSARRTASQTGGKSHGASAAAPRLTKGRAEQQASARKSVS